MDEKNRRWAFTGWIKPDLKLHLIDYLVWGEELTEERKLIHYQGYVEFRKAYSLKYVKSLFKDKTVHLEVARQNRECNKLYCIKGSQLLKKFEYNAKPRGDPYDVFDL